MGRDSFIFYRSFAAIGDISDIDMRDRLIWALIHYAIDGVEPKLNGIEAVLFTAYRPQIDANNKRYENGCKGAEYGKLGGAPKGNQNARKQPKTTPPKPQNNPKTTPNVNVNVNDNVNDTTVVVCNARTRAREAFCKAYAVTDDDTTTTDIDFDALSKAYSESSKWLQKKQHARRLSWAVKHYAEIVAGKYADFEEPPPTQNTDRNDEQIAKDTAADKASDLKQRLLDSDPEFYENEKALRLAHLQIAKGQAVSLDVLLSKRREILAGHNLTSAAIGDDYSAEATQ